MAIKYNLNTIIYPILALLFIFPVLGSAQVTKTDYFMSGSYFRNSLNPALQPEQGYLVIPVLPGVGASAQTNNFNLDNLTFKGPDGNRVTFMHKSVSTESFLSRLSDNNYTSVDANVKLFSLGLFRGEAFWNFDLGVRAHVDVNIPKPFFELLKTGFIQQGQTRYDLSDLSATGYSFIEAGASYSRPAFTGGLTVGGRTKLLLGLADFDLYARSLSIDAGPDFWQARSNAVLKGAAPSIEPKYDERGYLNGFETGRFNISGYGIGFDIGAVYEMKEALPSLKGMKVSLAINDIGFIGWTKMNSIHLYSPETDVYINPKDYEIYNKGGSSLSDVFSDAFHDIKEAVNLRGVKDRGYVSKLRMNMNLGIEYEILPRKLSAGVLYSARFGNYMTLSELTLSAHYRALPWLATGLSYSCVHSKLDTFGFALHIIPEKGINFFLASDYALARVSSEFVPTTSKGMSLQVGFAIPLGERRK